MHLLNLLVSIALLTTSFAFPSPPPQTSSLVPSSTTRGLTEPGNPMYCSKSRQFTIGYKICTFAAQTNLLMIAHLWLFNSECDVIGEIPNVDIFLLRQNDVQIKNSHFDFDSRLRYVVSKHCSILSIYTYLNSHRLSQT